MKFYDLEWLAEKCGTDNKYEITFKVSAEARKKSENEQERLDKDTPYNERFISDVLLEIEEGTSPINVKKDETEQQPEQPGEEQSEQQEKIEEVEQPEQKLEVEA